MIKLTINSSTPDRLCLWLRVLARSWGRPLGVTGGGSWRRNTTKEWPYTGRGARARLRMRDEDRVLYTTLETRLRALGLGRVVNAVLQLARPAFRLALTRTEEAALPAGRSEGGG